MIRTMLSNFESPGIYYVSPWVVVFSVETEDALAKSNTETIGEDDEEYGWD